MTIKSSVKIVTLVLGLPVAVVVGAAAGVADGTGATEGFKEALDDSQGRGVIPTYDQERETVREGWEKQLQKGKKSSAEADDEPAPEPPTRRPLVGRRKQAIAE